MRKTVAERNPAQNQKSFVLSLSSLRIAPAAISGMRRGRKSIDPAEIASTRVERYLTAGVPAERAAKTTSSPHAKCTSESAA